MISIFNCFYDHQALIDELLLNHATLVLYELGREEGIYCPLFESKL